MNADRKEEWESTAGGPGRSGASRIFFTGLLLAAAVLVGWTWGRASAAAPDGVRSDSFVLVDGAGEVRAALTMARDSAVGLTLHDPEGRIRLIAGVNSDGSPFIRMLNEFGNAVWRAP